jgi:transposase-like protein
MKGIYTGCPMQITHVFPEGAKRLCRIRKLSREATIRLRWFEYYHKTENASLTCRYFGISRNTFYKWKKRYNPWDLDSLETRSRAPKTRRKRMIPFEKELRIKALRKKYIRYGKEKLKVLYLKIYQDKISSWQIQKTIEKYNLYYHPLKNEKLRKRRKLSEKKKRITELKNKIITGLFFQVDTMTLFRNGLKRYIFTSIDKTSKLAFCRMYKGATSFNARDFLYRLIYLVNTTIEIIQTDNGS